jgi:arylsulfatase A-like enzyme
VLPLARFIFTGMYAHNHGVLRNRLGPRMDTGVTMQRVLEDAGYHTAIAGKYLQGVELKQDPPHFEDWRTMKVGYEDIYYNANGSLRRIAGYSTDVLGRFARTWVTRLESNDRDPWFLYIAPYAPHQPFTPAPEHADAPLPRLRSSPAMRERDRSDKPSFVRRQSYDPRAGQAVLEGQLRTLISVDELVGRLFRTLRRAGEARDTLAFFLSDNGFMLGEHGLYGKRLPYTMSAGIPLLMRWPGRVARGVRDRRLAANIDVAATVFDAAGVAPPRPPDGRSLLSSHRRSRILLEEYENGVRGLPDWAALRSRTWHYVEYIGGDDDVVAREYYDLINDPWLLENLLGDGDPSNDPDVAALSRELASVASCEGEACP